MLHLAVLCREASSSLPSEPGLCIPQPGWHVQLSSTRRDQAEAWQPAQAKGRQQQAAKAKRESRQAVLRQAEVVACTLAAAGGELASLLGNTLHFDGLIIDEVLPCGGSVVVEFGSSIWLIKQPCSV